MKIVHFEHLGDRGYAIQKTYFFFFKRYVDLNNTSRMRSINYTFFAQCLGLKDTVAGIYLLLANNPRVISDTEQMIMGIK